MKSAVKATPKVTQKKFQHIQDKSPIYLLDTFEYENNGKLKTYFVVSQTSVVMVGYMHNHSFNVTSRHQANSPAQCFTYYEGALFFGCRDGSILYGKIEAILNDIPLVKVESQNSQEKLLALMPFKKALFALDSGNCLRQYQRTNQFYKMKKQTVLPFQIKRVSFKPSNQFDKPSLLLLIDNNKLPLLVSMLDVSEAIENTDLAKQWTEIYQSYYLKDQKPKSSIQCIDLDLTKKLVVTGQKDGKIQAYKIEEIELNGTKRFAILKELAWQQKDNILDVRICPTDNWVGFISQGHMSCLDLNSRGYPGKKTKNSEQKRLNCFRWTIDKYFLVAGIIDVKPRMYCLDENL